MNQGRGSSFWCRRGAAWVLFLLLASAAIVFAAVVVPDAAWASSAAASAQDAAGAASSAAGSAEASEGPQIRWTPVVLAVLMFIGAGLVAKFGKRR